MTSEVSVRPACAFRSGHLNKHIEKGLGAAGTAACLQLHHTLTASRHGLRLPQVEMQASAAFLLDLLQADDAWIATTAHVVGSTVRIKWDASAQLQRRLERHRRCGAIHSTARATHSTEFAGEHSIVRFNHSEPPDRYLSSCYITLGLNFAIITRHIMSTPTIWSISVPHHRVRIACYL